MRLGVDRTRRSHDSSKVKRDGAQTHGPHLTLSLDSANHDCTIQVYGQPVCVRVCVCAKQTFCLQDGVSTSTEADFGLRLASAWGDNLRAAGSEQ